MNPKPIFSASEPKNTPPSTVFPAAVELKSALENALRADQCYGNALSHADRQWADDAKQRLQEAAYELWKARLAFLNDVQNQHGLATSVEPLDALCEFEWCCLPTNPTTR